MNPGTKSSKFNQLLHDLRFLPLDRIWFHRFNIAGKRRRIAGIPVVDQVDAVTPGGVELHHPEVAYPPDGTSIRSYTRTYSMPSTSFHTPST